ncbi:MAG: hypothetical protein JSV44_12245, partial [Candidatus Zixiibacteriota bacterium]
MLIRILAAIIVVGLVVGGYFLGTDFYQNWEDKANRKYALAIAETSVAAELHRLDSDSFFVARDSILEKYGLTVDEMLNLKDYFHGGLE